MITHPNTRITVPRACSTWLPVDTPQNQPTKLSQLLISQLFVFMSCRWSHIVGCFGMSVFGGVISGSRSVMIVLLFVHRLISCVRFLGDCWGLLLGFGGYWSGFRRGSRQGFIGWGRGWLDCLLIRNRFRIWFLYMGILLLSCTWISRRKWPLWILSFWESWFLVLRRVR